MFIDATETPFARRFRTTRGLRCMRAKWVLKGPRRPRAKRVAASHERLATFRRQSRNDEFADTFANLLQSEIPSEHGSGRPCCQAENPLGRGFQHPPASVVGRRPNSLHGCRDMRSNGFRASEKKTVNDDFFCCKNEKKRRGSRGAHQIRATGENRLRLQTRFFRSRASVSARR